MKKILLLLPIGLFVVFGILFAAPEAAKNTFLVLCYHDIPKKVNLDEYGVDQESFVQQIEYLRTHGYNFISFDDVMRAHKGEKSLPDKAVLLTFDDSYLSFYEFVFPILKLYDYPCILAVETAWIDKPDPEIKVALMSWKQLKEVALSKLVEIACHTHNLHQGIAYNPQGNTNWAAIARKYNLETKSYEKEDAYRKRIHDDLVFSKNILHDELGVSARAMVWPYGRYNQICVDEAKSLGFEAMFYLEDKLANINDLNAIPRYVFTNNPAIIEFIKRLKRNFSEDIKLRVLHADLDLIYDPDPVQQEKNLDKFIERVNAMKVNTVYLQAFCDEKGDGNISSVYFPNRVLPMRADILSRVVNQLAIRNIQVYAWMPMLSIVLPNKTENDSLRVMELKDGKKLISTSWYARLSPFSEDVRRKLNMLYEDMAINARIDGAIFLDDGYLNDFEDFSPEGVLAYEKISGGKGISYEKFTKEQKERWIKCKTEVLIELTEELEKTVRFYRPQALFARTLYAEVLLNPKSEEWYAQNFSKSIQSYDYVVIMAYPLMEKASNPVKWLRSLVEEVKKYPHAIEKTIFKVQTYDWSKKRWVNTKTIDKWLRVLVEAGAVHIGYYPDSYIDNKPNDRMIRFMMSSEDFPFKRKYTVKDMTLVK